MRVDHVDGTFVLMVDCVGRGADVELVNRFLAHLGTRNFSTATRRGMTGLRRYAAAAMHASDLGRWDVPDACAVLGGAWEFVERGHVTADDVKAFTHDNALAPWGDEMFANTVIAAR